jgi:hypothetical protein
MPMKPLNAEEIADLRKLAEDRGLYSAVTGDTAAVYAALPHLLDEVEQTRAGGVVISFEEDGKSVPFDGVMLEWIEKARALLKRIEWNGDREPVARCPACWNVQPGNEAADPDDVRGHALGCDLAALLG